MDSDDGALGGLVGVGVVLVLVAYVLQLIVQLLIVVVQALAILVAIILAVVAVLAFFGGLGLGGNLLVRAIAGRWGDRNGATLQVARLGLAIVYLAPIVAIGDSFLLALLGQWARMGWAIPVWGLGACLSLPAYYAAWWAKEVSHDRWDLTLPHQTELVMRAEEKILLGESRLLLTKSRFRAQLFWLRWQGGGDG